MNDRRPAIDRQEVARLRAEVDGLLRPLAKSKSATPRDQSKERARVLLCSVVDELMARGWSKRSVARHLGIDVHFFVDLLEGNRAIPGWVFVALPPIGRVLLMREIGAGISDSDLEGIDIDPPSSTGTHG